MNILLGLTGSVASTLAPKLVARLKEEFCHVKVVMTQSATHFVEVNKIPCQVFNDQNEWIWQHNKIGNLHNGSSMWEKNDPVLHIELRKWASALVVAPMSVNTLAKMSNGICDNLLTSIYRAWDMTRPVVVAPAANTYMWKHPITDVQLKKLSSYHSYYDNFYLVSPIAKQLACGDTGEGAMGEIDIIINQIRQSLQWTFPVENCPGIPVGKHLGAFLALRNSKRHPGKTTHHTGVDLYCREKTEVFAVEPGRVVGIEPFTGPQINSPWWNDTDAVLIEGASGVICYGELCSKVKVGDVVKRGEVIALVKSVLPSGKERLDIPGHSLSMLHMELYSHGTTECSRGWSQDKDMLIDPTSFLINARNAPGCLQMS